MSHYQKIKEVFEAVATSRDAEGRTVMTETEIQIMVSDMASYVEDAEMEAHTRGQHSVYMD